MNNNTNDVELKCDNCKKTYIKKKYNIVNTKHQFCGQKCLGKFKTKKNYQDMCERVGTDFKEWLIEKYYGEELASRKISELAYGKPTNSPNILGWMKKLGIPSRNRTDAVALQWKDNYKRRKETSERAIKNIGTDSEGRKKLIKIMQTDEFREKVSKANSGERNGMYGVTGEDHPNWNEDLTSEERRVRRSYPAYYQWRKAVFKRDGYTCQVCKDDTGGNLVGHHINGYHWDDTSRVEVDNGVTLCEACHNEFHSIYGYTKNNIFQFSQYKEMKALV